MSQRRRLPNSLKVGGQLDGWKWDCREADVARRLSVRSVVQRLWDQYQSEDSVSRRPVPGRPRLQHLQKTVFLAHFSGTKEKNHYCAAARCRPLSSIRKKNLRYYRCGNRLHNARSVCKKTSCIVRSPQRTTAKEPLMLGKEEHVSWTQQQWGFCAVHRRVQIYNGE
ncbi:uncharacterized protein TNCV_1470511 [Trichonephila clavipes]|nr:uncharacterized protein TNCV_1470511 [Trichonephila clavipes]